MHGLINKAIQCFVLDTYGRETWREMAQSAALPVMQFEAMLIYEDTLTEQALDATARFLDKLVQTCWKILEHIWRRTRM